MRKVLIRGQEDLGNQPLSTVKKGDRFTIISDPGDMPDGINFIAARDSYQDEHRIWAVEVTHYWDKGARG